MTDKQIIIDGVDVSGCEYLDNIDFDELCLMLSSPHECQVNCSNKPNCYYKQLMRKGQECQQAMDNYVQLDLQRVKEYNELVDLYKAKEQECEELKEKYKWYDHYKEQALYNKDLCNEKSKQLDQLKAENEELKEKVKELRQGWINCDKERNLQEANSEFRQRVINRYKQALTEIKEIAGIGLVDGLQPEEYSGFLKTLQAQILQKISEVIKDEKF